MGEDVHRAVSRCSISHKAKSQFQQETQGKDLIMLVIDRFSKIAHFVAYHKANELSHVANLYFKDIIRPHGALRTIVSDRDAKFRSNFSRSLWHPLGTKLLYSTTCQSAIPKLMPELKLQIGPFLHFLGP